MAYYELIYESGEHSIAYYEDDAEALDAIGAHINRAKTGVPGSAANSTPRNDLDPNDVQLPVQQQVFPAIRIVRALVYEEHPSDFDATNVSSDVAKSMVTDAIKEVAVKSVVNLQELAMVLIRSTDTRLSDTAPHESNFKAKEDRELDLKGVV